ncbi:MAG TPA: TetR/AcrR family transcriptional regulator [Candidatus Limosilactobacillus excrementigallinarum]|nr:TetR/AcrR family transcriptional regulator [Candidatus Limosilactobacillus excrementigallinarum]
MPTETFQHLSSQKKQNIKTALLKEFSTHPLATAQVARIVKTAGVARGTFYKYFADLVDAHQWLLMTVIRDLDLHPERLVQQIGRAREYQTMIETLMKRIQQSDYAAFLKNYYESNEGFLVAQGVKYRQLNQLNAQQWAIMVLCHQTIQECLMNPGDQQTVIKRLGAALVGIIGG